MHAGLAEAEELLDHGVDSRGRSSADPPEPRQGSGIYACFGSFARRLASPVFQSIARCIAVKKQHLSTGLAYHFQKFKLIYFFD
jgi:hypothetical protein